ncbi:H(+)-transporting V0 sector ATPase subunit a [Lunasporangiospora selenospora]|uniref:V-type proton ATPase subunit a n=1 Tax=Lunasporangiospora selenospora TaxID=979761 RepID=A0A9P6KEH1_9FUNG|nr:H(+)-transporting V0 sector ATPase subunit a [Lunasporangiospora selenospora]
MDRGSNSLSPLSPHSTIRRIINIFKPAGGEYVALEAIATGAPSDDSHAIGSSSSANAPSSRLGTVTSRLRSASSNGGASNGMGESISRMASPDNADPVYTAVSSRSVFEPYRHQEAIRQHYRGPHAPVSESTLFRSEEMSLLQFYIPSEIAQPTVAELGELGLIQFRDLNPDVNAFQRAFVTEIRRFDEMERQLRFFAAQIDKANLTSRKLAQSSYLARAYSQHELDELERRLSGHEARLLQLNNSYDTLQRRLLELTELKHVLQESSDFFHETTLNQDDLQTQPDHASAPLLGDLEAGPSIEPQNTGVGLGNIAGVIPRSKMPTFRRVLWRSLRGNLYMNTTEIDEPITDPWTDSIVEKDVFVIFAHGREVLAKIKKIAEALGASLYPVESDATLRRQALQDALLHIEELDSVLVSTSQTRRQELQQLAERQAGWVTIVRKEKATYHILNYFNHDINRKCLVGEGWCPTSEISTVQAAVRKVSQRSNSSAPTILYELRTHKEPPTLHKTNKFTAGFQAIVDAYGMARYREVNPGLFTVISFPFLFAVMFGDVGHGILVLLLGLYLVLNERRLAHVDGEMFGMIYGGRYIVLLMGAFSIFTGMMYNDIFSRALPWFQTGWHYNIPEDYDGKTPIIADPTGHTYIFGIDYSWHGAENYLLFTNSYKMKMSIILGVIHMSFGICMVYYNAKFFRKRIDIIGGFIPQMLFMQCLFGYLVLMVVYKWTVDWYETDAAGHAVRNSPPSLLNTMIYMFLSPGSVKENEKLYSGQGFVQGLLVFVAVICIPWMLFLKPYYLKHEHNKVRGLGYHQPSENHVRISTDSTHTGEAAGAVVVEDTEPEEEFDFSEELIHQVIHTIDFCLGCISNTASYLRLWALSLAHAQLSEVLWTMTLGMAWGYSGTLGAIMTIAMFSATGYAFEPFSFADILSNKEL